MATETVKITSNRILLKNTSGVITFDSNNLYLKTDPAGQFVVGGSLPAKSYWGGGGSGNPVGNSSNLASMVSTKVYDGPLSSTERNTGVTVVLPNTEYMYQWLGKLVVPYNGLAIIYTSETVPVYTNGKITSSTKWYGAFGGAGASYVKLLWPDIATGGGTSKGFSRTIFIPMNDAIWQSLTPITAGVSNPLYLEGGQNIYPTWRPWTVGITKQPETLGLAVSV